MLGSQGCHHCHACFSREVLYCCDSGRQWERPKSPGPENTQKLLKMTQKAHPPNYLKKKYSKNTKKCIFEEFLVFFEHFSGNFGGGPLGSFLVIFEYFRVRGIWVSLTGALNRNSTVTGKKPPEPSKPLRPSNATHFLPWSLRFSGPATGVIWALRAQSGKKSPKREASRPQGSKKSQTESKTSQNWLFFNYFDSFSTPF